MPGVVLLNCPGCGAPLETGSSHCTYCHARVQISADGTRVFIAGTTCQDCGWENAADRLFCGQCGANLTEKCHKCGKANPITLQYCGACGSKVKEARREALDRMVQEAKSKGWIASPGGVYEHMQLLQTVVPPEETVILFPVGRLYADLQDKRTGERYYRTAFVATDRSFAFVEPAAGGLLGSRPAVAKRVAFDEVESVVVDERNDYLVINFAGGQAGLTLSGLAGATAYERASGIVHYFKPFVPLRLQQGW